MLDLRLQFETIKELWSEIVRTLLRQNNNAHTKLTTSVSVLVDSYLMHPLLPFIIITGTQSES